LAGLFALRLWVIEPVGVALDSMEPTLDPGSIAFVLKTEQAASDVQPGDLVVFPSPVDETPVIKRVIAEAGQSIEVRDGVLYVDSVRAEEPFVDQSTIDGTFYPLTEVPAGTVFVMGDNRERSIDSRDFGPLPLDSIEGVVVWAFNPGW
ncbi:MAG TPA: signal peptidase I, partial [Arthrobacter sp.]|nr:signal peptidase I [Arthrobacter sp.]